MSDVENTMRINAPKGQQVVFKGYREGLWGNAEPHTELMDGQVYTVQKTKVFSSHSLVILEELPDMELNTVMFEETGELLEETHTSKELYFQGIDERRK